MADWIENECDLGENVRLFRIDSPIWGYEKADSLGMDLIFFLSKHASAEGVGALTTHSMGNWNNENRFGGLPNRLCAAAPLPMLSALRHLNTIEVGLEKTYEATHHGPLLKTPALFMELGGNEETVKNKELAAKVGRAAYETMIEALEDTIECDKIAIGIGSGHYPEKFSRLALEKGYAFSYMMPKYAMQNKDGSSNIPMIEQAVKMTKGIDTAVIEWKGLKAEARNRVIAQLNELGVEYERA